MPSHGCPSGRSWSSPSTTTRTSRCARSARCSGSQSRASRSCTPRPCCGSSRGCRGTPSRRRARGKKDMQWRRAHRYRDEVAVRARQQAAVADLGQRALAGLPLDELIEQAVAALRRELDTDYVSVLELTGDRRGLSIRAGSGLPDGVIGGVLPPGRDELPGYTLASDQPLLIEDYADEVRFAPSPLQRDLDIASAVSAPIGTPGGRFGVLGASSRTTHAFTADREALLARGRGAFGRRAEFRSEYRLQHHAGGHRWVLEVGTPRFARGEL